MGEIYGLSYKINVPQFNTKYVSLSATQSDKVPHVALDSRLESKQFRSHSAYYCFDLWTRKLNVK